MTATGTEQTTPAGPEPVAPAEGGKSTMKIAIPVTQGMLSMHFGHCEEFALIDVDREKREIRGSTIVAAPPHEPGRLPAWLKEQGADLVITGGMGRRAQDLFSQSGVQVIVGARSAEPEAVVRSYLDGTLEAGANVCDH
jgi:predicted Fe-Mo cluster-binding NifX family protein